MITLTIITIYLLIGAIIGYKDREMIEATCRKHDEEYNLSEGLCKASNIVAALGIILVAPIFELFLLVRKIKH